MPSESHYFIHLECVAIKDSELIRSFEKQRIMYKNSTKTVRWTDQKLGQLDHSPQKEYFKYDTFLFCLNKNLFCFQYGKSKGHQKVSSTTESLCCRLRFEKRLRWSVRKLSACLYSFESVKSDGSFRFAA